METGACDWEQPTWIYYGQIILDQSHCLRDEITGSVGEGRAVTVLYLAFSIDFRICRRNCKESGRCGEEGILNEGGDWICGLKGR